MSIQSQVFDVGSLSVEMIMKQKFLERDEIFADKFWDIIGRLAQADVQASEGIDNQS